MSLVKIDPIDNSFHCLVDWRIFKNDIGCFTTQFQSYFFICTGNARLNNFSNIS